MGKYKGKYKHLEPSKPKFDPDKCFQKAQIKSIAEAQRIVRTAKREGLTLYWYECENCKSIHMTRGQRKVNED